MIFALCPLKKNHNTVAVSGHPNPTHSPGVPGGGIETHKGEGYKNVQGWGHRNTQVRGDGETHKGGTEKRTRKGGMEKRTRKGGGRRNTQFLGQTHTQTEVHIEVVPT